MLGPFRVEYIRAPTKKARLLNAPNLFRIHVAGTSYNQKKIKGIANRVAFNGEAELVCDDKNPFDSNAVKVMILDKHVGFIPKELCVGYRKALAEVTPNDMLHIPLVCPVTIVGGAFDYLSGLRLDLPRSRKKSRKERK